MPKEVFCLADYVKYNMTPELKEKQKLVLTKVRKGGKIKIGTNEVTKAAERTTAKLVIIAQDVDPAEIVMHLPVLCKEKGVPFSYVDTKKELGELAGIKVATSALVVIDEGDGKKDLEDFVKKIRELGA